jgi:beta-phosphoglucomutase-like phosphatase (HAD superfamily)
MTKKSADLPKNKEDPSTPAIGLVLELEYMLFPGRQLMFKAFNSVLKSQQINVDATAFSRYCLRRTIEKNLQDLLAALGKKEAAVDAAAAKIKKQFESALLDSDNHAIPVLLALLNKAVESNLKIGLLSFLPEENARELMKRLPPELPACLHVMKKEADDLPTPDSWLSLLKTMAVVPRCAIAVVDGNLACKSALAVGMGCIVAPDSFTDWQDFTGADFVTENIADLKLNEITALLSSAHFRKRAK